MKTIIYKVLNTGSGSNIYFERLHQQFKNSNIKLLSKWFELFPLALKIINKKEKENIIHSNIEYGWTFKEKEKDLILTIHHNVFDKEYRKTASIAQKLFHTLILKGNIKRSLKFADKIVAVSDYTKKSFIETFGDHSIVVIYNGIDTKKFKPINIKSDDTRFKLLFVGNLTKRKGADLLPRIMEKLGSKYVLYYTSGLRTDIPKDFNLPNMVPLGKLSEEDLIKEYNKCDTLLFPTRLEGFGYAVAEAMACGKPIIATNCSSIPELVEDGKNGFLCEMNNVDDFAEKIKKISSNKRLRKAIYERNINKIRDNFSIEKMEEKYEKEYSN